MSTTGGKPPSRRASRAKGAGRGQAKTKIVVRRLPSNLPEQVFLESIKLLVPETSVERPIAWVSGKVSKNPVKGNTFARANIYFKSEKLALEFIKAYHGHLFVDKNGNEGRAYVEFAAFQKVPRDQKKVDTKQGTIEEDPEYIAFIQSLNAEPTEADKEMKLSGTELLLKETAVNPKSTPLLEALRAQKAAAHAKAVAAKNAARQARQAGKSGIGSKGQVTILVNRNAKENAGGRNQSSSASGASSKNPQGKAEDAENTHGSKPKRERKRRDRASKKASAATAASNNTGDSAPAPQITLLKPKAANNPSSSSSGQQTNTSNVESKSSGNTPRQGNQGSGPNPRRGPQQSQQQQQQQQGGSTSTGGGGGKKESAQASNTEGAARPNKPRRNRGDRAKSEAKVASGGGGGGGSANPGNSTNANNPASGNKGSEGQGSGGSNRPSRTRRGRGGGGGDQGSTANAVQG